MFGVSKIIRTGDVLGVHLRAGRVKHPKTGKDLGTKVLTKGWVRVLIAQETSATAVVGSYAMPGWLARR